MLIDLFAFVEGEFLSWREERGVLCMRRVTGLMTCGDAMLLPDTLGVWAGMSERVGKEEISWDWCVLEKRDPISGPSVVISASPGATGLSPMSSSKLKCGMLKNPFSPYLQKALSLLCIFVYPSDLAFYCQKFLLEKFSQKEWPVRPL